MLRHTEINDKELRKRIRQKKIFLAGNRKLKIYGVLNCKSGKRMKKENRVFFDTEKEAIEHRFRPCGHCMNNKYQNWKNGSV